MGAGGTAAPELALDEAGVGTAFVSKIDNAAETSDCRDFLLLLVVVLFGAGRFFFEVASAASRLF